MSIKIENVYVFGWESAIRGMRNPMNSWDKSDSFLCREQDEKCFPGCSFYSEDHTKCQIFDNEDHFIIGENDLKLMQKLIRSGSDHSKFMRMINVALDIAAPLYWWKEFDTYKVGTVANSCSTMHKIHAKEFTLDDFSCEHLLSDFIDVDSLGYTDCPDISCLVLLDTTIEMLNYYRIKYIETKGKVYWWQMIQLLPSSYNQRRTVQLNYQVLRNMYFARRNHKLDEWRNFCSWIETLPYAKELICSEGCK